MRTVLLVMLVFVASFSTVQGQSGNMAGMDMSPASSPAQGQDLHDMPGMPGGGSAMAMNSMESHHMGMGPHMKITALRPVQPRDQEKADQVAQTARNVLKNIKTTKSHWPTGSRFSCPMFSRSDITSRGLMWGGPALSGVERGPRPPLLAGACLGP